MSKLTQGTQIYVIDPRGSSASVLTVDCATNFTPGGSPKSQIDDTCLDETEAMKYRAGLMSPGQGTITINADPTNPAHIALHEMFRDVGVEGLKWAVGWSDGTENPGVNSSEDFDLPATRTWFTFEGYISDFPFDFQGNAVVVSTLNIQRSGAAQWIKKAA